LIVGGEEITRQQILHFMQTVVSSSKSGTINVLRELDPHMHRKSRLDEVAMGETITAELACRAFDMAWYSWLPAPGLIFHSDRGSQYASGCYANLLASYEIKASMSGKDNCWDNACSETLLGSLVTELLRENGVSLLQQIKAKTMFAFRHKRLQYLPETPQRNCEISFSAFSR